MKLWMFTLGLSVFSVVLYLMFNLRGWLRSARNTTVQNGVRREYFIGLLFAGLFYLGLPIWLWRYGLRSTFKLFFICIGSGMILLVFLRSMGMVEVNGPIESFFIGQLIQVPIRAIAGTWLARNDTKFRSTTENYHVGRQVMVNKTEQ